MILMIRFYLFNNKNTFVESVKRSIMSSRIIERGDGNVADSRGNIKGTGDVYRNY